MLLPYLYNADTGWNVKGGLKTWFKGTPVTGEMSNVISQVSTSLADGNKLDDIFDGIADKAGLATEQSNRLKVAFQNYNAEGQNAKQINKGVTASLQGLTGGISKAAVKQAVMNAALNTMVSIGIMAALTGIAKGYQYLSEYQEKTIETGREATNSIKESNKVYADNANWLKENGDRYTQLAKGVENGTNISLTTAEFEEYNQIISEITTRFPELIVGYDSLGNAILSCGDDINKLNEALSEQKDNNLAETLGKTSEIIKAFQTESNTSQTFLQALGFGDTTVGQESAVVDALLNSAGSQEDFIKAYSDLNASQRSIASGIFEDAGVEAENIEDYYNNIDILVDKNKTLQQARVEATEGMQELASAYLQDDVIFKEFSTDAQNALINIADNLSFDFFTSQNLENTTDFKVWSANATKAIKEGGLQDELDALFSSSPSKLTKSSFANLNKDIKNIADALQIEDVEEFKLRLGIDEETFNASFEAAKENLIAELDEDFANDTAVTNWLNTLTQSELDIVANFELRGTESLDYLQQKVVNTLALTKDLENLSSEVDTALGSYGVVTTALAELNSEGRITSETLESLQKVLGNVEGTFQYTSQGIQVNAQALKQMADNAAEVTLTEIEMREALDVVEYQKKTAELNKYCEAHEGLREALENNSLSEYNDGIENVNDQLSEFEINTIEALYASTTALAENINGYDELEMRIHAASSALNDYMRAQETANASDNMQTAAGGLEGAKNLYDQGWTTKDDYTSYMDYIGYQDKGTDNYVKHAEELFKRAEKYLTEDASGVHKFINDMISKGIEGVEGTDYTDVKFTPKVDLDNVADEMDMTLDFVTDMFLAMRDAGYEVNFSSLTEGIVDGLTSIDAASETARTDLEGFRQQIDKLAESGVDVTELEAIYTEVANAIQGNPVNFDPTLASLDELTAKSEDARQSIAEIANNAGVDFEFKADLNGDVSAIENQLESLQEFKDTQLTVGTEEWENANLLIAQTVGQLHEAENEVILNIDTSKLDAKSTTVVNLIKQFRELQNEKEVNLAVNPNFNTQEIDGKLESIRSELASLNDPEYTTITTTLGLDKSSVESLNKSIKQITPEVTAKFMGLNDNGGTININGNTAQYDAKLAEAKQRGDNTVVTMQIEGDTGQLIVDANAGKSYIEGLSSDISVGANTSSLKTDISSALRGPFSISVNAKVSGLPGNTSPANGTAHSSGTVWHYPHAFSEGSALWQHYRNASHQAYAGGTWGLNQDEHGALINELGPEIIVRDGRWFTVNNGYPTLTDLRAGDIIFNHKQSEAILSKGYVTGSHGKLLGKSHADGTVGGSAFNTYVTGGGTNLVKPVTGSSSKKTSSNKVVSTSKKTTKKTKKALDAIADWFDWIEVRLDRLARDSENAEKAIDRAAGLGKTLAAVNTAISAINKEHEAAEKGAARYLKAAQTVAKNTGLSASLQKKVQNGTIDISKYSETTQKKIQEYQKWYEKYLDCLDLVTDLEDQAIELALSRLDKITEYYDAVNSVHESLIDANDAKLDYREAMGYSAVSDAQKELLQSSINEAKAIQANAYSNYTRYQDEFNSLLKAGVLKKDSVEYYDRLSEINDLKDAYYEASTAVLEHADALREVEYIKLQQAIDKFARASEKIANHIDLLESRDEKASESMYVEQIKANNGQIDNKYALRQQKLAEQATYAVGSIRYQELAEEIAGIDGEIINLLKDNEALKDSIVELRFDPLIESVEGLQDIRSELEDFMDLINEEALFDSDTGALTGEGVANIYLIEQAMNSAKQEIAEYTKGLAKLDENFANGNISQEEFNEMNAEYREDIRDAIKDVKSYADTLSDLYITQMEKENELLQEIIDKRKEALKRKEDYYNYDKTLRNQTKELNLLKAQAAALEGSNDAASQAQLKRLKQQIVDAEEELQETKRSHSVEMQEQGYDALSKDLSDVLADTELEIKTNAEKQLAVIDSMLQQTVNKYAEAYGKINEIIANTGFVGSGDFNQSVNNAATEDAAKSQKELAASKQSDISATTPVQSINTGKINLPDTSEVETGINKAEQTTNRLVAKIELSKTSVSVQEGKSISVKATVSPSDAANKNVKWTSSNTKVATVSNGTIKGVKAGSCAVTVTAADGSGVVATVSVTVTAVPKPAAKPTSTKKNTSTDADKAKKASSDDDGKIKKGEKVTFSSGKYTAGSDGSGSSGKQKLGKEVYIAKVKSGAKRPYLLSTDKAGKHLLGWVSKSQLKGYASGSKYIDEEQFAWTQEQGSEIITLPDGSVLTKLPKGAGVIPHNLTENLWGLANSADDIMANTVGKTMKLINNVVNNGGNTINYHYDSLLTVNGDVDKAVLPELKEILKQSYQYTTQQMTKDALRGGNKLRR